MKGARWRFAGRFGWLLASAGLALSATSCRIDSPGQHWIEAHGGAVVSAIAASPRGVIGAGDRVYAYPGVYAQPWVVLFSIKAQQLGASPSASYALDNRGYVWRGAAGGSPIRWEESRAWNVSFLAADEADRLFVISDGAAKRVENQALHAVACTVPAVALAASELGLFVVTDTGALMSAPHGARCEPLATPGKVTSVAAFGKHVAIVVDRVPYRRVSGRWQALPKPRRFRDSGITTEDAVEVAQSKDVLWLRDDDGFVYMLSDST